MQYEELMKFNKFVKGLQDLEKETGVRINNLAQVEFSCNGLHMGDRLARAVHHEDTRPKDNEPVMIVKAGKVKGKKAKTKSKRRVLDPALRIPIDGDVVREKAKKLGLSLSAIAREINQGHETVLSHYVCGRHDPDEKYFLALAELLQTDPKAIVGLRYHGNHQLSGKLYKGEYAKTKKGGKVQKKKKK